MTLHRVQVELTGWNGAPGINTFHCEAAAPDLPPGDLGNFADALEAMYTGIRSLLVPGVTARLLPEAPVIDEATGQIIEGAAVDPWTVTAETGGTTSLSRATMIKVRYTTGTWADGRQIRGGIYLGPVDQQALDTDGSIPAAVREAVTAAHAQMFETGDHADLVVYRRPRRGHPTLPDRPGKLAVVTAVDAMPLPAVLRSRRD